VRHAAYVVSVFVFRNEADGLVVRFIHQDFQAGKQLVIDDVPIDSTGGDQILLELTHSDPKTNDVTARYQFWKNGAPASAPVALRGAAPIFGPGEKSWTRGGFFAFEQATRR